MVKLSVIVPIYNVEAYLAECLNSIFSQNIEDMEVIAIIDGSPDNSIEIARDFAAQHSNMRVIEQENRGLSASRNRGIREAQGEYICWIDSDDYYTPGVLSEALRLCLDNNLDTLAMALHQFPREVEKAAPADNAVSEVMNGREFLQYAIDHNYLYMWPTTYLHKRSFLLENNLFFAEGIIFESSPFSIRLASIVNRCMYYNAPLIQYRIRSDSLSHGKRTAKDAHDILTTLLLLVDACESADIAAEYMPAFSDALCKRACFCAITYAELTEAERAEYKALCTPRERMYFHTFVSPIFYRNWLVKKHKKSAADLEKKNAELNKKISELNKKAAGLNKTIETLTEKIEALQAEKPQTYIAKIIPPQKAKSRGPLLHTLHSDTGFSYIYYISGTKHAEVEPINSLHADWFESFVSAEVIASRYQDLFPALYYHLVWRDQARTPLALGARCRGYGDSFEDVEAFLSDGGSYSLLPSFFNDREEVTLSKNDGTYLWNQQPLSPEELRDKLVQLPYDAVLAEEITQVSPSVQCLYDSIYLDIIVLNAGNTEPSVKISDAFLVVKNARRDETDEGLDVFVRLQESTGQGQFGLPDETPYDVSVAQWDSLQKTLCDIIRYLSVFNGLQFHVVITPKGPKILRMMSQLHLPDALPLSQELIDLSQRAKTRKLNPTEEHAAKKENEKLSQEQWNTQDSKRHWPGMRAYMGRTFDEELQIDSQDPKISEGDRLWCYKRGFFSYRMSELGLNEDNYRHYVSDYEYFWVNRINSFYQSWIANKLSLRFMLDSFKDKLPEYYYSIHSYNGEKKIIDLPDLPNGYTRDIDSVINLVKAKKQLAIKKSYGSHGDGFIKFSYANGSMYLNGIPADRAALEQCLFEHEAIHLITEYVGMHPFIATMYPDALNTVRINCMNKLNERGIIGACFLKVGHSKGGYTDNINTAAGGIIIELDKNTGLIRNSEFKRGNWYTPCPVHPDTHVFLEGTVPHWDEIIDGVKRIASAMPQIEYMGFDIAVTPDSFKVIEINVFPDYTKFLLKDNSMQDFLKDKVAKKKAQKKISPDRHSWLD